MADNRLFSPPGVVAMGNALSSRMSRPNLLFYKKNTEQNTKWDEDKSVFRLFILNKINNSAHTPNIDGCLNSS